MGTEPHICSGLEHYNVNCPHWFTLRNDFSVELADWMGDDQAICDAARVSTLGADAFGTEESAGLINFLAANRHGSPFEHTAMKFRITSSIFVWREFMRHRIGFSYNEESGRYKKLDPVFYVPPRDRPLIQVGKPGKYSFEMGTLKQHEYVVAQLTDSYLLAWQRYDEMVAAGIAKEVARMCLPVGVYSSAFVTCNARSMMAFLSLRTKEEGSKFPSYPQWEIEQVARQMETEFARLFPLTYAAFNKNGRVGP